MTMQAYLEKMIDMRRNMKYNWEKEDKVSAL